MFPTRLIFGRLTVKHVKKVALGFKVEAKIFDNCLENISKHEATNLIKCDPIRNSENCKILLVAGNMAPKTFQLLEILSAGIYICTQNI